MKPVLCVSRSPKGCLHNIPGTTKGTTLECSGQDFGDIELNQKTLCASMVVKKCTWTTCNISKTAKEIKLKLSEHAEGYNQLVFIYTQIMHKSKDCADFQFT